MSVRSLVVSLSVLVAFTAQSQSQPPTLWSIPGAYAVQPGPSGSVYVIGSVWRLRPTPGAWITGCEGSFIYGIPNQLALARVSLTSRSVIWSTCLPLEGDRFQLRVDPASGDILAAGSAARAFQATSGAITSPRVQAGVPGEEIGIVRLRPDGAAATFAALIASNPPGSPFIPRYRDNVMGLEFLPDGSIFLTANTAAPDFPVTADAIETTPGTGGYLLRVSSDGSRVLYGSYLSRVGLLSDLVSTADGKLVFTGRFGLGFPGYPGPTLPFGPGSAGNAIDSEGFVARFDPAVPRQLESFARFGITVGGTGPKLAIGKNGNPVLAANNGAQLLTAELRGAAFEVVRSQRLPLGVEPSALRIDRDGNWALVVNGSSAPPPVTTSSLYRPTFPSQTSVLRIDPTGSHILSASLLRLSTGAGAELTAAADGTLYAAIADYPVPRLAPGDPPLEVVGSSEPLSVTAGAPDVVFYANPKNLEVCGDYTPPQALVWDVSNVPVGALVQVHLGSESGPVIATGATGSVEVEPGNNTYTLVLVSGSNPFFSQIRVLGTETTKWTDRPLHCAGVTTRRGTIGLFPNPVLGCVDPSLTGTQTQVTGQPRYPDVQITPGLLTAIRVGSPSGPLFAADPGTHVSAQTGDWVRNGLEFFLSVSSDPTVPLASKRAYVLPIRDCRNNTPPGAAIRAVRDCANPNSFTLAYHSGNIELLDIRANTADGPALARVAGPSGLVDIETQNRTTIYLTVWREGKWVVLASAIADPEQECEQGQKR